MASPGLQQLQKQTLALTPQLKQSLKILQAPSLELRKLILEELQANPTLEELPPEEVSIEQETQDPVEESVPDETDVTEMDLSEEDYSILNQLNEDYREYFAEESAGGSDPNEVANKRQHFFDSLVSEPSLQGHLLEQVNLVELTQLERQAINYLVGSLDDRGFLTIPFPELAKLAKVPLDLIQSTAKLLKTFDPLGIGAADLKDCLLIQLQSSGRDQSLAARIIRDHFELLLRRRIPEIARKTATTVSVVQEAFEEITRLDPAPGRKFSEDSNRTIAPDVCVQKEGHTWTITLSDEALPRLRISHTYKAIIAEGVVVSKDKAYILEKIRSGKCLINAIEQRQQTIQRITEALLAFQKDFFEEGISKLKPLTMGQMTQQLDLHETTVSRAIANKYIETPHGIFDFKYFFAPGYTAPDGQSVSNKSIKDRIATMIGAETPAKPLSDQDIVKLLAEENIKIARRTVAKYREALGILSSHLRRTYQ